MIYLHPQVVSGLGEDTFWTWFQREFPSASFDFPRNLSFQDVLLQYSTLGFANRSGKSIALLWELYPEMKYQLGSSQWDYVIEKTCECARFSTYRVVASPLAAPYYEEYGKVDILPIGVDCDLFKPLADKQTLRGKYNIPQNRVVGYWGGTTHTMKGFLALQHYAQSNPDIYWIVVWKWDTEAGHLEGASNFVQIPQSMMCELMNAADFFLCTSKLRPFYMVEWEAMAANLPMRFTEKLDKDFIPSANPRDDVFRLHWDRRSTKKMWAEYFSNKGVTW
jgi:glycosyltransferase involved in cell wall biosynthesis